jgi:hypothetical protein
MDCPESRAVQAPELGEVIEVAEVGGLHHHDERYQVASEGMFPTHCFTDATDIREPQGVTR